ncbi:hypothetical protein R69746_07512 [Paraburkholderia aspalathi]|uniref:AlbA family DNA-binding domain-containing protein n=1 Tax=Paraburkholderia aspalathi TaxID=1324617 RepID=UPI00190A6E8B|nr:ATP-binding protein [Paraburkholderia aspalathi]MBK3843498.1 ATP-binding protein [Paraburkholderia aspalathi]CAE6854493.1 hypothetical protein R69746_07512 [Paraburkholderia aspalathi]CAE6863726.1 hypothetical protein R75465_07814 [Paraburkholderia aspalathi]
MIPYARLDAVTEGDIQDLIDHGVRESRTLDYKRDWPADRDARIEIAKDVCAFANSLGGDLVFGVDDGKTGVAIGFVPVTVDNLDGELLVLTSFLRDTLEPRVTGGLHAHPVPLAAGGHVVILRVSPSPSAPHRVTKDNHFYARTSVGKEPMDIHGIRNAFAASASLGNSIRNFCDDALTRLERRLTPALGKDEALCVCHVVPVSAFSRHETHDIDSLVVAGELLRDACSANLLAPQINLDGVAGRPHRNDTSRDGVQLYRNGAVELAYSELLGRSPLDDQKGGRSIFPEEYEIPLVRRGLIALAQAFGSLDVNPPAYLMLSWLVGSEARVAVTRSQYRADFIRLPENAGRISAPPIYLEDFGADPLTVLRPAFDVLWNAVGVAHTRTDFAAADPD